MTARSCAEVRADVAAGRTTAAETLAAAMLAVSAIYIAFNETLANWQALWLCGGFIGLAVILLRARDAPD